MPTESNRTRRAQGTGSLQTVRKHGHAYLVARWYDRAGERQEKSLGRAEELSRKQAEAKLRELIAAEAPAERTRGDRPDVTTLSERYLAAPAKGSRRRKPSTVENLESDVRCHLADYFGRRPVDGIDADDVADLITALERKGLGPKSIRNIVGNLSALMNFAKAPRRGWARHNPCEGAELPELPDVEEIRYLTVPELRKLTGFARKGMYQEYDRALYLAAGMTGLRLGELLALRWRDVDWPAGKIRVRRNWVRGKYDTPKSRRSSRAVPLADEVGGELDRLYKASRWQGEDDHVFAHPVTGRAIPKANVTRRLHDALADAGLDETHVFHDLRHTFGTTMAAAGVPMRTLQEWMGHKHLSTTERYADYAPGDGEAETVTAAFAESTVPPTFPPTAAKPSAAERS